MARAIQTNSMTNLSAADARAASAVGSAATSRLQSQPDTSNSFRVMVC